MVKLSWQQLLQNQNKCLEEENYKLQLQVSTQGKQIALLEKVALAPPTIMIACEKLVDAAAHQVSDMLQFVKETRR